MGLLGRDGYWNDGFEYEPHPDHCKKNKRLFYENQFEKSDVK